MQIFQKMLDFRRWYIFQNFLPQPANIFPCIYASFCNSAFALIHICEICEIVQLWSFQTLICDVNADKFLLSLPLSAFLSQLSVVSSSTSQHGWPPPFTPSSRNLSQHPIRGVSQIWGPKNSDCEPRDRRSVDIWRNFHCMCHRQFSFGSHYREKRNHRDQQNDNLWLPLQCDQHGGLLLQHVIMATSRIGSALHSLVVHQDDSHHLEQLGSCCHCHPEISSCLSGSCLP